MSESRQDTDAPRWDLARGKLEEKADLLDLLLEATNDGVVDWDLRSKQTYYNDRWRFLLGWDESGLVLTPDTWREFIHVDERAQVEQAIIEHLQGGWPFAQTVRMRHRSMGWRWILMRGTARRDRQGEAVRMVIIFADVDARVRAESEVRAMVEAIPDTILRVGLDGRVLAVKEGNRLKRAEQDPKQPSCALFDTIQASESGARVMDCIQNAGAQKEVAQISCRIRSATERPIDYDIRIVGSAMDEAVCIVRDVTREKTIEEQLARGRKLEAIGQLAGGLAHEINTPLQYISDSLYYAEDAAKQLVALIDGHPKVAPDGDALSPKPIAKVDESAETIDLPYLRDSLAAAIARGLRGIGQIDRLVGAMKTFQDVGRQSRVPQELNDIVEKATIVATHAWSSVADLSLRLDPELPFVPCVAGQIAQVVVNLLVNAAQALREKLGDTGKKGTITVETLYDPASEAVEIRIRDDGVGIPEAIRAKVFDPFFTTRPVGQGSGQGLAQVHATIVGLHGGSVHFDSRVGEGTCFVATLPLREVGDRSISPMDHA